MTIAHRPLRICHSVLLPVLTLSARLLSAQGSQESQSVHHRNECRLAAQTLTKGHPAPKSDWALEVIPTCDESAGAALAAAWQNPTSDSTALEQLVIASGAILDSDALAAILSVASNGAVPTLGRLAALRALAAYVDPHEIVFFRHLRPSADSGVVSRSNHSSQTSSVTPPSPGFRDVIRARVQALATQDPDAGVRFGARQLKRRFSW